MHGLVLSGLAAAVASAAVVGKLPPVDSPAVWIALAIGVAVLGVPHGGLDHEFGRRRLRPVLGDAWTVVFFAGYLAVAVLVVIGWMVAPRATVMLFFLASAWHFGREEFESTDQHESGGWLAATAVGGLVIWIPVLLRPSETSLILESVVPFEGSLSASRIVADARVVALPMLVVAAIDTIRRFRVADPSTAIRRILFALMFATAPVPISFGVYFCGYHSVLGLASLRRETGWSPRTLAWRLTPLSLAAVAMIGVAGWWFANGQSLGNSLTQTIFIGLSAIAVPHLVLHAALPATSSGANTSTGGERVLTA